LEIKLSKIAFGGGCHWCTEAVFLSLKGVEKVDQGFVSSTGKHQAFSEAVVVLFDATIISLTVLVKIHLLTHKSTSNHSMRRKYRSGIYTFNLKQKEEVENILLSFQAEFNNKIITKVYPFSSFQPSQEEMTNYYYKNPQKPFCKKFIEPKLELLVERFSENVDEKRIK